MKKLFLFGCLLVINSCIIEQVEREYTIRELVKEESKDLYSHIADSIDVSLDAIYYDNVLISELHFNFNNYGNHELFFDSTSIEYESNQYKYELFSVKPKNISLLKGQEGKIHFILMQSDKEVKNIRKLEKEVIILKIYGYLEDRIKVLLYYAKLFS